VVVVPTTGGAAGRVATTPDTLPGASQGRNVHTEVRIVGSLVDSIINDLILTPLLLYRLEPITLEQCLTLFAE
jgi:hypothetical protein